MVFADVVGRLQGVILYPVQHDRQKAFVPETGPVSVGTDVPI